MPGTQKVNNELHIIGTFAFLRLIEPLVEAQRPEDRGAGRSPMPIMFDNGEIYKSAKHAADACGCSVMKVYDGIRFNRWPIAENTWRRGESEYFYKGKKYPTIKAAWHDAVKKGYKASYVYFWIKFRKGGRNGH